MRYVEHQGTGMTTIDLDVGATIAPCEVCKRQGTSFAAVDGKWLYDVCPEHDTLHDVAALHDARLMRPPPRPRHYDDRP